MGGSALAELAEELAGATPREALTLVTTSSWLLEPGSDAALADLVRSARRRGDGPLAERLEAGRLHLQRCREYGPERVMVRGVLDQVATLDTAELDQTLHLLEAEAWQGELRRRIDGALDVGDVGAWGRWLQTSIALERASEGTPIVDGAGPADEPAAHLDHEWAEAFLETRDAEVQRAMLRAGNVPLARARFDRLVNRASMMVKLASFERDALEAAHVRRSVAMAAAAEGAETDPQLAEDVLAGRKVLFCEGYIL